MSTTLMLRELIANVNNAKTEYDHRRAEAFLRGYRQALNDLQAPYDWTDADLHHEGADAERPMCLGVFLDWQPSEQP